MASATSRSHSHLQLLLPALRVGLLFCAAFLGVALGGMGSAHAQEVSAENKAAARDLALDGIQLAQSGKCEEAIPKLQRAEKLFHAPTILTWIGECQVELGRYVEGTETLNRVVREKLPSDAPSAYFDAQEKAQEVLSQTRPKIAKVTIDVAGPQGSLNSLEGLVVQVDGKPIAQALVGAPRPTDPGTHRVEVSAPGYHPGSQELTVDAGGKESITILLEVDARAAAVALESSGEQASSPSNEGGPHYSRPLGWSLVGAGGLFLVGGGVTGILAITKKNALDCPNKVCPSSEEDALKTAKTYSTLSSVFFGVGGVAVVSGVVVLLTGKPQNSREQALELRTKHVSIQPTVGLRGVGLRGRF